MCLTQRWSQRRLRRSVSAADFRLADVSGGVAQLLSVRLIEIFMRFKLFIFCILLCSLGCRTASVQSRSIVGEWIGKGSDGRVSFNFQKDGSVLWLDDKTNFKRMFPSGLSAKYVIREQSPFWEIDIYDFKDVLYECIIFRGILQSIDDRTFRMQGMPSNRGERPKNFDNKAVIFTKLSA